MKYNIIAAEDCKLFADEILRKYANNKIKIDSTIIANWLTTEICAKANTTGNVNKMLKYLDWMRSENANR